MVRGLSKFREWFRPFEGFFALIGGAACDEWFTSLPHLAWTFAPRRTWT